jgi:parvulin-like peptidyl-prolyl isomerase
MVLIDYILNTRHSKHEALPIYSVSYSQYLDEKDYIHHFYESTKQQNIDLAEIDKQVLNQLIEDKIITAQAKANNISISQADIDKAYSDIIQQNGGQEAVDKVLHDLYGISSEKFKSLIKMQLLRDKVTDQMIAKVKARHILVRVDSNAPQAQVDAARAKIQGLLDQIKGGADFAEVAKKSSEDVGSADQGGLLDPFAKGEMVQAFSDAAFSTPVGQISDPVRTEFGWHIVKVEGKTGKIEKTFADWLSDVKKQTFKVNLFKS